MHLRITITIIKITMKTITIAINGDNDGDNEEENREDNEEE